MDIFFQEPLYPILQQADKGLVAIVHGQHQNMDGGVVVAQPTRCFKAVHAGHIQIQQNNMGQIILF